MNEGKQSIKTHTHVYGRREAGFGGPPDYYCAICGFRIPESMIGYAINHGAALAALSAARQGQEAPHA